MWLRWILPRGDSSRIPNHPRRWIALHGAIMAALDMWTVWLQVVQLWRKELSKINPKAAESLADPAQYKNLFPNIDLALKAEQLQARTFFTFCLSAAACMQAHDQTQTYYPAMYTTRTGCGSKASASKAFSPPLGIQHACVGSICA